MYPIVCHTNRFYKLICNTHDQKKKYEKVINIQTIGTDNNFITKINYPKTCYTIVIYYIGTIFFRKHFS